MGTSNLTSPVLSARRSFRVRFYPSIAVIAILFSLVAFGPSLVNESHRNGPPSLLNAVHGAVFCGWLVLFLAQAVLVSRRNLALHRTIGTASLFLAAALVILGYATTMAMVRRGYDLTGDLGIRSDPLAGSFFPLLDTTMFAVLFTAAWLYRHRAAVHKRLMLLTICGALVPAPIAHFVGHFAFFQNKQIPATVLFIALFLAVSAIHDLFTQRHIHPISLWVPLTIFVIENASANFLVPSKEWHKFAAWLTR